MAEGLAEGFDRLTKMVKFEWCTPYYSNEQEANKNKRLHGDRSLQNYGHVIAVNIATCAIILRVSGNIRRDILAHVVKR